jgi:alkylhydroperoxidase family enzyme
MMQTRLIAAGHCRPSLSLQPRRGRDGDVPARAAVPAGGIGQGHYAGNAGDDEPDRTPEMGTGGMMARISYVDPGTVTDPELAGYLADAREHGTPRLESQAIRAHVPAVLRTFSQSWQQVFRDGVLDHRIKELARVFIAKSLECGYCAAQRSDLGAAQGLTESAFDEVIDFRQSQLLTARDKAALRWAEAIAWDPGLADDDLWAELHRHFTEPELVELGYFIGLTMGQQRFLKTLGVRHGDLGRENLAGLAPEAAADLAGR